MPRRKAAKLQAEHAPVATATATATSAAATTATKVTNKTRSNRKKPQKTKAEKAEAQDAHYALVFKAAHTVTEIFKSFDLPCVVFGSLASKLYGSSRCPKDVDLLVIQQLELPVETEVSPDSTPVQPQPYSAPELKNLILRTNSRNFYLKMPRDPEAEYRILWYRESYLGPECKVDILVPGIMHLPSMPSKRVIWVDGIPLVPFSLLLLHKLQGWDDHRLAEEAHKNRKQQQDAADVRKLMALAALREDLKSTPWDDPELFSDEFMELSRQRVKEYCRAFPDRVEAWKRLGFEAT